MSDEEFWILINHINSSELDLLDEDDYPEELLEPLVSALSMLYTKNIEEFEDKLSCFLYNLDGEKYADNADDSGRSGDGFLYSRCWVVAKGKKYYEEVLTNPLKMPKKISQWCEPLIYVSSKAWALNTGNDEENWEYTPKFNYETGSNSSLW